MPFSTSIWHILIFALFDFIAGYFVYIGKLGKIWMRNTHLSESDIQGTSSKQMLMAMLGGAVVPALGLGVFYQYFFPFLFIFGGFSLGKAIFFLFLIQFLFFVIVPLSTIFFERRKFPLLIFSLSHHFIGGLLGLILTKYVLLKF